MSVTSFFRRRKTSRSVSAGCFQCNGSDAIRISKNAQAVAALHHDKTGHQTWCDVSMSITYGAEPEADLFGLVSPWRLVRVWETAMVCALPKNDESVEWWNGEAWDLVPTLHLSPHEIYRTKRPACRPNDPDQR